MRVPFIHIAAVVIAFFAVWGFAKPSHADDGAASIAAGGIVVMGHESRITMAKEVLRISKSKIVVDYDFRNDTGQDVTTEVAFPIPPYLQMIEQADPAEQSFDDFHLWVNNAPAPFRTQARAIVNGKDLTPLREELHVDTASFGNFNSDHESPDIIRLSVADRQRLVRAGLTSSDDEHAEPKWEVHKKYHWRQKFPARSTTHIRHEYTPVVGYRNSVKFGLGFESSVAAQKPRDYCMAPRLEAALRKVALDSDAPFAWVDFILTSANTWKKPIEDFTLFVEHPHGNSIGFCWDGPVTKLDADHFVARVKNFIPKRELTIGFFDVTEALHN